MTFDDLKSDFEVLEDWEDRYRYIIELGRKLPPLPSDLKTEATKVRGCTSQVWLVSDVERTGGTPTVHFRGESDAHIVQGLVAILFALYDGKTPAAILETDAHAALAGLGLKEHLSPQRSNGLASMVERIRADASALVA